MYPQTSRNELLAFIEQSQEPHSANRVWASVLCLMNYITFGYILLYPNDVTDSLQIQSSIHTWPKKCNNALLYLLIPFELQYEHRNGCFLMWSSHAPHFVCFYYSVSKRWIYNLFFDFVRLNISKMLTINNCMLTNLYHYCCSKVNNCETNVTCFSLDSSEKREYPTVKPANNRLQFGTFS